MTEDLSISGYVVRQSGAMKIEYQVKGALDLFRWRRTYEVVGGVMNCGDKPVLSCFLVLKAILPIGK